MSHTAITKSSPQILALLEGAVYLWFARRLAVHGANVRLRNLVQVDERLAAHLDALMIHRGGRERAYDQVLVPGEPATVYMAMLLFGPGSQHHVASVETGQSSLSEAIGALCWFDSGSAAAVISRWVRSSEPGHRAVAIAATGARRFDPDAALAGIVADPLPAVRARARRTAGQLGRADLMAQLRPGLVDEDPECRFWSAWAAARMGAGDEALRVLADIAWNNLTRADRALDLLLRRLDVPQANAWLREFAKIPGRQRAAIRATGVIGDPLYIPWLIERMNTLETARLAGEAFSMITGLDLSYRDLDRRPPQDFESGPNDDPADENVALDEDEHLPWPDPEKIGQWWVANRSRFDVGTPYFLGTPKPQADWLEALSNAFQRQRHAAALELAIRQPDKAMFEVRARGRLQRQLIARARGLA
jgi:uncharacterized protein (TIGR02270 family)